MNGARPILDLPAALGPIPKTMRAGVYRGKGIVCVEEVPVTNGGGLAEYVKAMPWVAERGIVALPDDVSFEEGTFIEPVNTIAKAVQKARVTSGETVLVIGCGPVGLLLLMVSKLAGARVFTSDPMAERRAKSLQLGASEAFDPSSGKLVEEIWARTEGRG